MVSVQHPPAIQSLRGLDDHVQRDDVLCENYERAVRYGGVLVASVVVDAYKHGMLPAEISQVLGKPSYVISRMLGFGLLVERWSAKEIPADEMPPEGRCRAYLTEAREEVARAANMPVNKLSSKPRLMERVVAIAADKMNAAPVEGSVYSSGAELIQPAKHYRDEVAEAAALGARLYKRAKGVGDALKAVDIATVLDGCETSSVPERDDRTLLYHQIRRLHKITGDMLVDVQAAMPELARENVGGRL